MAHELLVRAAKLIEQARALNDEFPDKTRMPAEAAQKMDRLLAEATKCRQQVEREAQLEDHDKFLHEPDYKGIEPGYGAPVSKGGDSGPIYLTDGEKTAARKAAFFEFLRKGAVAPERKADLVQDANGDLLVPQDYAGTIVQSLPNVAVMRNLAFVRPTSRDKADVGVVAVNRAGWGKLETGDTATDGLGGAPTKESIHVWDLLAEVKIGQDELEDADADLEAVISNALVPIIAQQEDEAFASGTGDDNKQPLGFASDTSITQKVTAAGVGAFVVDELKALQFAVPQKARARGVYVGSTAAEKAVALLKDANDRYYMQYNSADGEPPTIFGYRWYTNDGVPAPAASGSGTGNKATFFGDFNLGYMIADRRSLSVQRLNERYADQGKVGFIFKLRVGGGTIRPNALAYYQV